MSSTNPLRPRDRALLFAGRLLMGAAVRFAVWSAKIEYLGLDRLYAAVASGRPVIMATWHGNIFAMILGRLTVLLSRTLTMVSRSRDGEIATRLARPFGVECVRASSSKGGAAGLREFRRALCAPGPDGRPRVAIHFLDGPRGPRRKAKPGLVHLARASGALIVPVEFGISRFFSPMSWDRHRIPLPFARIVFSVGEPIDLGRGEPFDRDEEPEILARVEAAFRELELANPLRVELADPPPRRKRKPAPAPEGTAP